MPLIPHLPAVWGRLVCLNGCGLIEIAAPNSQILADKMKTCPLCHSTQIEIQPVTTRGVTTKKLPNVAKVPRQPETGFNNTPACDTPSARNAYFDRMELIEQDEQPKRSKPTRRYIQARKRGARGKYQWAAKPGRKPKPPTAGKATSQSNLEP